MLMASDWLQQNNTRAWCKGSTPVFKTGVAVSKAAGVGSNPTARAIGHNDKSRNI